MISSFIFELVECFDGFWVWMFGIFVKRWFLVKVFMVNGGLCLRCLDWEFGAVG